MATPKKSTQQENSTPARIVEVDPSIKPIPARVISTGRDIIKDASKYAIFLLLFFFVIQGYVKQSTLSTALRTSRDNRTELINEVNQLSISNQEQTAQIKGLENAIKKENKYLVNHGFRVIGTPGNSVALVPPTTTRSNQQPTVSPSPTYVPQTTPTPRSSPSKRPSTSPSKSSTPVNKTTKKLCETLHICLGGN